LTVSEVVPVEPVNTVLPEYVPEIESEPAGAAAELHEPLPFDNVAVQSAVPPVEKETEPPGVGTPDAFVVTVAE
jgi:hypothetical protein